jgi:hypothetical protein
MSSNRRKPARTIALPTPCLCHAGATARGPEQRGADVTSDHTALREDRVSNNPRVNLPYERRGDRRISQQVAHKGKQILIRKCLRIERLNGTCVAFYAFSNFDRIRHAVSDYSRLPKPAATVLARLWIIGGGVC